MSPTSQNPALEREIQAAFCVFDELVAAWVNLGSRKVGGEIDQLMYGELIEYAALRVETATSMAVLARNEKVADALGLGRSLLEHMLLLRLMARGKKYIEVGAAKERTSAELKAFVREAQQTLKESHAKGELLDVTAVRQFPRGGPSRLMWVREGLTNSEEPDFFVSLHYFYFKEFRPNVMRVQQDEDIDLYMPKGYPGLAKVREARAKHKRETKLRYDFYLSWSSLMVSLGVNDLVTPPEAVRIESHYTFLGQFLHPTHDAAKALRDPSNWSDFKTTVGATQPYDRRAVLLAALYSIWLLRTVVSEIAAMLDAAPERYIKDPGTEEVRAIIDLVPQRFGYFWFIDNEAPLWDKFNWAVHKVEEADLVKAGGYGGLASDPIHFPWDAYDHLKTVLIGQNHPKVGSYESPLQ